MNFKNRLTEIRHAFETGDTPAEVVEVLNRNVEELLVSDVTERARKVGECAPLSLTVESNHESQPLSSYFGEQFLVLTWFRGNW